MSKKTMEILISVFVIGIILGGLIWKANNPNDYRHPRDRQIKIY